jgi:hypothetical protein
MAVKTLVHHHSEARGSYFSQRGDYIPMLVEQIVINF